MRRRARSLIAVFLAAIAISSAVTPALAVTNEQYNSTLSFYLSAGGACRTYHGTKIHIQLTTTGADSSQYSIEVWRCNADLRFETLVGSRGICEVPAFCGYNWAIALNGLKYGFYFKRTGGDGHDVIQSNSVQMWSTS